MKVVTGVVLLCLFVVVAETTTTRTIPNPRPCQNGGYDNGIICVCPDEFYGPLCENIKDRFKFETTTEAATDTTVVKGTRDNIITHDFSTTSITTGHTIPEDKTDTSTTSTHNTPTTTTRHTIPETTKSLFTTPSTTTPLIRATINPRPCQNGGIYDGIKCICPDEFYGPLCENINDRFEFGTTVETTVKVELRFPNKEFNENLSDNQSDEYKEFVQEFKEDMNIVYKVISGYKAVNILSIREGSVIVDHEVTVDIEYNASITVTEQYKNILQDVEKELNKIVCGKITQAMISDCISDTVSVMEGVPPITEDELCSSAVPSEFKEFYSPIITADGLLCVSHCDPHSPRFMNCNEGTCQLERGTGLHCLCPYTASYMYTKPQCTGKISKTVLFVSVGVTIGILLIVVVILVVFCFRMKTKAPKILTEEEVYYSNIKG